MTGKKDMKIRDYAQSVGFEVVGKIRYIGLRKVSCRWYMDDAGNAYVIDTATGEIEIKPHGKGETLCRQ